MGAEFADNDKEAAAAPAADAAPGNDENVAPAAAAPAKAPAGEDAPAPGLPEDVVTAVRAGDAACLAALLENGASVDVPDNSGFTALNYVVTYGDDANRLAELRLLLDAGADVDKCDNRGFTPLIHGCVRGRGDAVRALLAAGANYDLRNEMGHDAEAHACAAGHEDLAGLLADVRAAGSWAAYEAAPPLAE
ncbi:hypothetical protein JL721_10727 [Aureococcus anophagefferens]|nr:hypothetical protein JL721_10727 [Aureococcus anophagefferens]